MLKITKYPQSTLLIEEKEVRLLIDPGSFALEKFNLDHFGALNAVLLTHQHFDHLDKPAVKSWWSQGVQIFGNSDVYEVLKSEGVEITMVKNQVPFKVNFIEVTPIDLPHCKMLDGSPGPPNTGFIIAGTFFHPGDGIELAGKEVETAAIPITGPTITYERAWNLALSLKATNVIPMHYSNPKYNADPTRFADQKPKGIKVIIINDGESVEI